MKMLSGKPFILLAFALATCHCSTWYQFPRREVFYPSDLEQNDDENSLSYFDEKDKVVLYSTSKSFSASSYLKTLVFDRQLTSGNDPLVILDSEKPSKHVEAN